MTYIFYLNFSWKLEKSSWMHFVTLWCLLTSSLSDNHKIPYLSPMQFFILCVLLAIVSREEIPPTSYPWGAVHCLAQPCSILAAILPHCYFPPSLVCCGWLVRPGSRSAACNIGITKQYWNHFTTPINHTFTISPSSTFIFSSLLYSVFSFFLPSFHLSIGLAGTCKHVVWSSC